MMKRLSLVFVLLIVFGTANFAFAQSEVESPPDTPAASETIDLEDTVASSMPLQIIVLLTVLSFIPALLISMTCFTRLIVVFHFLRQALGTQEAPNNQVLLGLALFITLFVMGPTLSKVYQDALKPMIDGEITQSAALEKGIEPLREYMIRHTREKDLALFIRLSNGPAPETAADVPTTALVPAYMISELKTAFQIGFVLFLPFLVIDLAVSSVLLSMGMMQLPPVIVSLPLKILLFVMVDGWYLIISSLVKSVV
ncbi:MAG: flagellar type III secretion system pore protein FliP [Pyrinomonadaceae bacterium]|nr:flagellar type III secretion system pore protein FliP [Pyrinomonadaceae bacterium]